MSDALTLGVFRSTWGKKASLLEVNPAMRSILGLPVAADMTGADWLERIIDPEQRSALVTTLSRDKAVQNYHLGLRREDGGRAEVSLFAVLVDGESGQPVYLDGILEDISRQRKTEEEREALIARLQTSLFFLREPITQAITPALSRGHERDHRPRGHALMKKNHADGRVRHRSRRRPHGHRHRPRLPRAGRERRARHRRARCAPIMSAPVATIPADAPIYEALLRMQERDVDHLAVMDDAGQAARRRAPARPGPLPAVLLGDHHRLDPPGPLASPTSPRPTTGCRAW